MGQHIHHNNHSHAHEHDHAHNHEDIDYGSMYAQPWVQAIVRQIQDFLVANAEWLGIDPAKGQRVLDYACGHGTISLGVLKASPKAICRGIDLDASQVGRYNENARELLGEKADERMRAVHGDLYNPTESMTGSEWGSFDLAIMSMALHHVKDPIEMLRLLKERLRPGGTIVVVEFLRKQEGESKADRGVYDPQEMIEVNGKQKIWPGFTTGNLRADLEKAGFGGFEARVLAEPICMPKGAGGEHLEGEKWCFFAKATVQEA